MENGVGMVVFNVIFGDGIFFDADYYDFFMF